MNYTTVLEVWDFPFLLPQPTTSILFSTPSPISGDESSRVGSYPTPLTPHTGGRGMWDRTAPRAKRHLRWTEARGHHAPTTHLIEIINGGSHRHSTAKSIITMHPRTHPSPLMLVSPAPLVHTIHLSPSASFTISSLSSTLQHSCSCSNPRHQSPSLICSSSTPVAVEAPTPK